jgi:thiamine-phosphate pyrophosphorylase
MNDSNVRTPSLHLITDPRLPQERLLEVVRAAAANGVDWVHLRDRAATARDLFDLAERIVAICAPFGIRVAVNDRVDVALVVGAAAVQIGRRGLPIAAIRRLAPALRVGASVHSVVEAIQAEADGADWLTFGHVFPTSSHPDEAPRGLEELRRVVEAVHRPVVAIGGVGVEQVAAARAAGASGIAVISAILDAEDPARATREIRNCLGQS